MKKMLSLIIAIAMVAMLATTAFASPKNEVTDYDGVIDVCDALRHPEKYSDVEVVTYNNRSEFLDAVFGDENLSDSQKAKIKEYVNSSPEPRAWTDMYLTFRVNVKVTSMYTVQLRFYTKCKALEGAPNPEEFVEVIDSSLKRDLNPNIVKQFKGRLVTHLETAKRLHWILDGDFFNDGTTTWTDGFKITIGESFVIDYTTQHSTDHYDAVNESDNIEI